MIKKIVIGSRDSKLAMVQTDWVAAELKKFYPELEIEIIKIKTQGDIILDVALSKIGDKGLFTKELENELLAGTIDLAVHSMKDLPTKLPEGLEIAATTKREDVRDVVCMSNHALARGVDHISKAGRVASSSLRRVAQLRSIYPEIDFVDMRGNLQTRFTKLDDEANGIDAVILAAAGLNRLGLERITQYLDPEEILPAVGQGALGIEIKSGRHDHLREFLRKALNSETDEKIIIGERAFLRKLEGGCQVPIGIYSQLENGRTVTFDAMVASVDGTEIVDGFVMGDINKAEALGIELAEELIDAGAKNILNNIKSE